MTEHRERGGPVGVLTVDDQPVFLSAAREVIEATPGFTSVGEASCGEEALILVEERAPELVLMDVRMTGMDGIETTRRIKAAHPELVVVLVSLDAVPPGGADSGAAALVRKQDFGSRLLRRLWLAHGAGS
jgi:two-component system, NarL family, invasion response regulator UvrY